jgi:hypothetical protein
MLALALCFYCLAGWLLAVHVTPRLYHNAFSTKHSLQLKQDADL